MKRNTENRVFSDAEEADIKAFLKEPVVWHDIDLPKKRPASVVRGPQWIERAGYRWENMSTH